MAVLTKKQIQKIKEIIEQHFHAFIFRNLGADHLEDTDRRKLPTGDLVTTDHFKTAFLVGKHRGNVGAETLTDKTHDEFLQQIFNRSLGQSNLDKKTLDLVKASIAHYLENLKNRTVDTIVKTIHDKNRETHMDNIIEGVPGPYQSAIRESRTIDELVSELKDKTEDIASDWDRTVRTELATIHNQGAVNAIVERNRESKKEDVLVYAQGPLDDATCEHCREHYHDGSSYKVYRLSELLANGTNMGRKSRDWQAVVPPMHPRCRHRLVELLPGWTLDEDGRQVYVGPDHHEFNNDIKKGGPGSGRRTTTWKVKIKGREGYHPVRQIIPPDMDDKDQSNKYDVEGHGLIHQKDVEDLSFAKGLKTPTYSGHKLHKRIKFQGMDISVENKKGSYRHWRDRDGKEGKTLMQADYGYIRRTVGNDGDHVDAYIGPNQESRRVFVIHQVRPDTGEFDEDKVMLGFDSPKEAKEMYLKHYDSPKFFGSMDELDIDTFKDKVLGQKVDMIKSKLQWLSRKD